MPLRPKRIISGLLEVPVRVLGVPYVNAFVLTEGELALVDTGLPRRADAIRAAIRAAGRRPEDLRHIALTHHHPDHRGNARPLALPGTTTYAHLADIPVIDGSAPAPGSSNPTLAIRAMEAVGGWLGLDAPDPAVGTRPVADGEVLAIGGGLEVVHTPGHTPGHVSYLWRDREVLFAGDAASRLLRLGPPLGGFTEDMATARRSIRRLAGLEFEVACFGHGRTLAGRAAERFRRLAERLEA